MHILLAEDDANISLITQICLEKIGGHTVVLRSDGDSALQAALAEKFDLIILDGMMPKKSGIQVALDFHAFRALNAPNELATPIIFLSAKTDEKDVNEFLRLGTGYIPKPFDPQSICSRIEGILAEHQGLGQGGSP